HVCRPLYAPSSEGRDMAQPRMSPVTATAPAGWAITQLPVVREPLLLPVALIGVSSVGTLLMYFFGVAELAYTVRVVLIPATVVLAIFTAWARSANREEIYDRIVSGLWAGTLATLIYDIVRVPVAMAGVPVFRAISYFGTIILAQPTPTLASEIA